MCWTAKTNSRSERGLLWKTPDWTGKRAVCQPLKATLAVMPTCRRLTKQTTGECRVYSTSYDKGGCSAMA